MRPPAFSENFSPSGTRDSCNELFESFVELSLFPSMSQSAGLQSGNSGKISRVYDYETWGPSRLARRRVFKRVRVFTVTNS